MHPKRKKPKRTKRTEGRKKCFTHRETMHQQKNTNQHKSFSKQGCAKTNMQKWLYRDYGKEVGRHLVLPKI